MNRVERLQLERGIWCEDQEVLKEAARRFYADLYTKEICTPCNPKEWSFLLVSHRDRHWLNRPITQPEVIEALSHMGAYKAPGPDGFPACFFQKY